MTIELKGPIFKPQNGNIEKICVFFHGWGSNGDDLIGLAPIISKHFPEMLFVSPNAPELCDLNPLGRQWFDIVDREKGIDAPFISIKNYINKLKIDYSLTNTKIFLGQTIKNTLDQTLWFFNNDHLGKTSSLSNLVSKVCDKVFDKTPVIKNELIRMHFSWVLF